VTFEQIQKVVAALRVKELRSFVPVEIFHGGGTVFVTTGAYSILLRATFQSDEGTLRQDEVARWSGEIVEALGQLGGSMRTS
jgi:phenylalanyl-tRNA synthetase beta chain